MFYQFTLAVLFYIVEANASFDLYNVPNPKITIDSNGFEVEIGHEDGIELFYFHGKVLTSNVKVAPESVIDMLTYEREGDKWILRSNYSDLHLRDIITYWLYVKKSGVGYRLSPTEYVVTKINQKSDTCPLVSPTTSFAPTPDELQSEDAIQQCASACDGQLQNLTHKLSTLKARISLLRKSLAQISESMDMQNRVANFSYLNNFAIY